jgi:hypothetical protein
MQAPRVAAVLTTYTVSTPLMGCLCGYVFSMYRKTQRRPRPRRNERERERERSRENERIKRDR